MKYATGKVELEDREPALADDNRLVTYTITAPLHQWKAVRRALHETVIVGTFDIWDVLDDAIYDLDNSRSE